MNSPDLLDAKAVMKRYGYTNRTAFNRAVKQRGIPCIRINARVIRFDPVALTRWEKRRSIGNPRDFSKFGSVPTLLPPPA